MRSWAVSAVTIAFLSGLTAMPARPTPARAAAPSSTTARTVVAATTLSTVTNEPLYFGLLHVMLPAKEQSSFQGAAGIIYQLAGSTRVSVGGKDQMLRAGEGIFIAARTKATLRTEGAEASTFLHFLLEPATSQSHPVESPPATVKQLYRTSDPIPDLKAGAYDLNLTRITFPPRMPSNAPHYRSGAALYYILSGTGANTIGGKTVARPPGSVVYEPFGLVHQWGNPGATPLTFLPFNINPEGAMAVFPAAPKGRP
ncbi:MAG: cupin domain-containing protein [Pseudomonadota bacterium]|nr:cupin domain-containing protein [Pseudomonadota bacterium]